MWCLGSWFSGGLGSVRLALGLNDLEGLFQRKQYYDSMILTIIITEKTQNTRGFLPKSLQARQLLCDFLMASESHAKSIFFNNKAKTSLCYQNSMFI